MSDTGIWYIDMLNWSNGLWNDVIDKGTGMLTQSPEALSPTVWDTMTSINKGIQGIGYGLLVLCFLVSLFRNTTNIKDFSLQGVFGYFLRFLGGKIAIDYSMTIMSTIITVVLEVCGIINKTGDTIHMDQVPDYVVAKVQEISTFDIFQQIPIWLIAILGLIINGICVILFIICIYGRFFRVYVHIALAPIGLAGLGGDLTSSMGKRYIMSFLSVCLESALIVLAVVICKTLVSSGLMFGAHAASDDVLPAVHLLGYMFNNMFAMILLVTFTFGVNKVTKEMFGGM